MSQPMSPVTPAAVDDWGQDIEKLRSMVNKAYPQPHPYATDYNLYRWLRAWRRDLDTILPLLNDHLKLREVLKMDEADGLGHFPMHMQIEPALKLLKPAYGFEAINADATDRDGNVLGIIKIGKINLQAILENTRNSDYILSNLIFSEQVRRSLHELEITFGKPMGCTIIYDLRDLKLGKALLDVIQGGSGNVTRLIQSHFPELTRRILVINVPSAIDYIWIAVKVFLAERTKKKIVFLGSDWRKSILEFVDLDNLPQEYGGTSQKVFPDPIDIPPDTNIYNMPTINELKVAYIKPRQSVSVDIPEQTKPGSKFSWFFKSNGELLFMIEKFDQITDGWSLVVPKFPLNSFSHPEFGVVELLVNNKYKISFRNDSSLMFSTKLEYSFQLIHDDRSEIEFEIPLENDSSSYLPGILTKFKRLSSKD